MIPVLQHLLTGTYAFTVRMGQSKQCITILEDNTLLGKLSDGDMIAKDAMYHSLLVLYRRSKQKACVLDDMKMTSKNKFMVRYLQNLHFI